MSTATDQALPQHLQAFAKGNHIRLTRAAEKRRIKGMGSRRESLVEVAGLVTSPPEHLLGMRVIELVASCHRTGLRTAERWLCPPVLNDRRQGVRIGDLTPGEKRRVLDRIWRQIQVASR